MPDSSDPVRHNQLVDVARLYYLRSMTHQQIAEKRGLSRVKVTRMLQQAVDEHIVEFRIADPAADTLALQDRLETQFGLRQAIVVPGGETPAQTMDILGRFAAGWLSDRITGNMVIGLGWGRTLNALVPHLPATPCKGVQVVSLIGGLAANANQPNPYDTATAIAGRIGAQARYLLLPAVADSETSRDLLLAQTSAASVTDLWSRVGVAMMSIGLLAADTGVFYSLAEPKAGVDAVLAAGGAGDLLGHPFDRNGRFIPTEVVRRTIAIDHAALKRIPFAAGVACGTEKTEAIRGALKTGLLNVLITDETAARAILDSEQEQ